MSKEYVLEVVKNYMHKDEVPTIFGEPVTSFEKDELVVILSWLIHCYDKRLKELSNDMDLIMRLSGYNGKVGF